MISTSRGCYSARTLVLAALLFAGAAAAHEPEQDPTSAARRLLAQLEAPQNGDSCGYAERDSDGHIRKIAIRGKLLSDDTLRTLGSIRTLEHVSLHCGQPNYPHSSLGALTNLSRLRELCLVGFARELSDEDMRVIGLIPSLQKLVLNYTTVPSFEDRGGMLFQQLKTLDLHSCRGLNPAVCSALARLGTLETLDLTGTDLKDDALLSLRPSKSLKTVHIGGTHVTEASVLALGAVVSFELRGEVLSRSESSR